MKKYKLSDHYDGELFKNPGNRIEKSFADFLRWRRTSTRAQWPKWVENEARPAPVAQTKADEIHFTFINHVTFLIQTNGLNILTDPVFSKRVSPLQWLGPQRVRAAGMKLQELPRIDAVLISHNHYDHMDLASLKFINREFCPRFITPLGNAGTLRSAGIRHALETDWWDSSKLNNGSEVITVPAQHWSGRMITDRNRALWAGFILMSPTRKIFFAGDTGYGPHFREIRKRMGPMDISLLPIGAYEPRWFMKEQHMNPEEAVQAHLDLDCKLSIGTHFGVFQLTDEAIDAPVIELEAAKRKMKVENFHVMEVGETRKF